MTRKDFELIARVLSNARITFDKPQQTIALNGAVFAFASELASTNDRFDKHRFLRAAGVESKS
jgi:hypothetical protein